MNQIESQTTPPISAPAVPLPTDIMQAQRNYWLVWGATLLFFMAFYALLVPLPNTLKQSGLSDAQIGFVLSAFGVAVLIGRPFAGRAADRWSAQRLLLFGNMLLLLGIAGMPLARHIGALFGLRMLQALGYVVCSTTSTALIVRLTPVAQRVQRLALFGIAANVAMTITPAIISALLVGSISQTMAFAIAGALALAAGSVALFMRNLPPVLAPALEIHEPIRWLPTASLRLPMLVSAAFGLGFGAFLQFLPLLSSQRGAVAAGWLYTGYGIGIMLTRLLSRRWLDRANLGWMLACGLCILAAGLAGLALVSGLIALLLATLLVAIGNGILHPLLLALHARRAPYAPGLATAMFYLGFDGGNGVGSWLLGVVLEYTNFTGLYGIAALMMLLSLAAIPALTRR